MRWMLVMLAVWTAPLDSNGDVAARVSDETPQRVMDRELSEWRDEALNGSLSERLAALTVLPEFGTESIETLRKTLEDDDASVRYWSVVGLGRVGLLSARTAKRVHAAMEDESPIVQVAAAEAVLNGGDSGEDVAMRCLVGLSQNNDFRIRLAAMWVFVRAGDGARAYWPDIEPRLDDKNGYVVNVAKQLRASLFLAEEEAK